MRCPVPCYLCGQMIELSDAAFFTDYCECLRNDDECTHGMCRECNSSWNEMDEDED